MLSEIETAAQISLLRGMGVDESVAIFPQMITPTQSDLLDAASHLDIDALIKITTTPRRHARCVCP